MIGDIASEISARVIRMLEKQERIWGMKQMTLCLALQQKKLIKILFPDLVKGSDQRTTLKKNKKIPCLMMYPAN
ncbi:hypothetical protein ACET3Z_021242 [Daucus carota]